MTATSPASDTRRKAGDVWRDRSFRAVALVAGLLVLAILGLIAYATTAQAWPAFRQTGFSFITSDKWNTLQTAARTEIQGHTHKGGADGTQLPGEAIRSDLSNGADPSPQGTKMLPP